MNKRILSIFVSYVLKDWWRNFCKTASERQSSRVASTKLLLDSFNQSD